MARATRALPGLDALALATLIAAGLVAPVGLSGGAGMLADARLTGLALSAGLLAVLAFSLEFVARKRLPARTFGVLLSLEPAVVSVLGLIFLGEALAMLTWLGIALVVAASIGGRAVHQPIRNEIGKASCVGLDCGPCRIGSIPPGREVPRGLHDV